MHPHAVTSIAENMRHTLQRDASIFSALTADILQPVPLHTAQRFGGNLQDHLGPLGLFGLRCTRGGD
jgi:hypothetical protein